MISKFGAGIEGLSGERARRGRGVKAQVFSLNMKMHACLYAFKFASTLRAWKNGQTDVTKHIRPRSVDFTDGEFFSDLFNAVGRS